jgi:PAS domain S-box-containing protein
MDLTSGNVVFEKRKAEMLGYQPEKFQHYKDFMALVHPGDYDNAMNAMQGHINGFLNRYEVEYRIFTQSGEYKWFYDIGSVVKRDSSGKPWKVAGLVIDITERKRTEEALRESRNNLNHAQEIAHLGSWDWDIARSRLFWSDELYRIFGIDRHTELTFDGIVALIHPEDRLLNQEFVDGVLNNSAITNINLRIIRQDGSIRHIFQQAEVQKDENGKVTHILGTMQDITDRIHAEEEVKESKALFETIVENVPLMIFLKEATDLRFIVFNRAGEELLGHNRKELLGKNNLDLFPPEQAIHFHAKDREVLDGEAQLLDIPEEPIDTLKNGQRLLHTRKIRVLGPDGVTKYLLGISEDITERKMAEEEIKRQLKELEEWYEVSMNREERIIELKKEINSMLKDNGRNEKYEIG